ncbi:unnamed protein product [Callosobruchus maculatus]|uniref:Uncharacterized protein n=1 Tax=Callosobruchus maculatus TaxID=64391 RepID=A0A653DMZ9_CALMS|nr:unnamed protein product [Callosobruchus maculatus]
MEVTGRSIFYRFYYGLSSPAKPNIGIRFRLCCSLPFKTDYRFLVFTVPGGEYFIPTNEASIAPGSN